jgi:hypothetical protein
MRKLFLYLFFISIGLLVLLEIYTRLFGNYCEPWFDKHSKIIKRKKNTQGTYKTKNTENGYFRINNEGWNSYRDYFKEKKYSVGKGKKIRIAIIGHSNIEGLRVPVEKTSSRILENELVGQGKNVEVYTFGYGGMHLAQALHVSRYVMHEFAPDIIIIGTLLDNFLLRTSDKRNFLSLNIVEDKIIEVLPDKYQEEYHSPFSFLYFFKAVKYTDIRFSIGEKIISLFSNFRNETEPVNHYLRIQDTNYKKVLFQGIDYLLNEFKKIDNQAQIIFVDFPQKIPSYNVKANIPEFLSQHHSRIIEEIENYGFHIVDIKTDLYNDYSKNRVFFDFPGDAHYNQRAHEVIGKSFSDYLVRNILK